MHTVNILHEHQPARRTALARVRLGLVGGVQSGEEGGRGRAEIEVGVVEVRGGAAA